MQSFIISSKNLDRGVNEAKKLSSNEKVNFFDLEILEFESLGIEDVRKIQKKIFLKPFRGEKKSLIIVLRGGLSDEAQNSMLKLLEEPPPSSLIFLVTTNHLSLLPTILSRAKIIQLSEKSEVNKKNLAQILEIGSIGEALALAQDISKDKNSAILWLEDAILSAREEMLENLEEKGLRLRKLIHKIELAHYDLKNTNANARLILENLFLNINDLSKL